MEATESTNKYGLSRKTNIALATIAAMATAQGSLKALIGIGLFAFAAITYQFIIDFRKAGKSGN